MPWAQISISFTDAWASSASCPQAHRWEEQARQKSMVCPHLGERQRLGCHALPIKVKHRRMAVYGHVGGAQPVVPAAGGHGRKGGVSATSVGSAA